MQTSNTGYFGDNLLQPGKPSAIRTFVATCKPLPCLT
jgi:hypothetical protein